MGIGFVLFIWAVLLGGVAAFSALVLGLWSWWNHRRAPTRARVFKTLAAAALPFLLFGYGGVAFAAYAIWCETIRGVDPGVGDVWRVPVANDYFFCMIDVVENAYLLKGGCAGSPMVAEITELAAASDLIVGNTQSHGAFLLDTRTDGVRTFATIDAALAELTPRPILRSAGEFYDDRRWGKADAIVGALIVVPPAALTIAWFFWFIRARSGQG